MVRQEAILRVRREKVKVRGSDEQERKNIIIPGGVLPPIIMAYMGRLRLEGVPYSYFRHTLQALLGVLAARREKEGKLVTTSLEFEFHLQFPCGSPLIELSDFGQSARSGNERECKQTLKNTWKHAPRVMTSLLMSFPSISISDRLSRCRDIQIPET